MTSMPDPNLKAFRKETEDGTMTVLLHTKKSQYGSGRGYCVMKMFMTHDGDTKVFKSEVIPSLKEAKSIAEKWQEEEGGSFELSY